VTRWTLAVFGAIGVAFLGSLPFVGLGELDWTSYEASWVLAAASLLVCGLILTLRAAAEVYVSRVATFTDFADNFKSNNRAAKYVRHELFQGVASSPEELRREWDRARLEYWRAASASAQSTPATPTSVHSALEAIEALTKKRFEEIDETTSYVVSFTAYRELVVVYRWAQRWIYRGAVLVLVGALAFFALLPSANAAAGSGSSSSQATPVIASGVRTGPGECPAVEGATAIVPDGASANIYARLAGVCQQFRVSASGTPPRSTGNEEERANDNVWFRLLIVASAVGVAYCVLYMQQRQTKQPPLRDDLIEP
jgi:hypothetical protein